MTPSVELTAELELILRCVRRQLDCARQGSSDERQAPLDPIQVDAKNIDWQQIPRLARRHKLVPVVFAGVSSIASSEIPDDVLEKLRRHHAAVVYKNMALGAELVRIVRAFRQANLPIVAFKGPTLANDLYGGLQHRQFVDLDLLIRPQELFYSLQIFDELGYCLDGPRIQGIDPHHLPSFLTRFNDRILIRRGPTGRNTVELHWRFTNMPSFFPTDYDAIFDQPHFTDFGGAQVQTLAPTAQLIYLAFHSTKHLCTRLSWLCDFALSLNRRPRAEWADVICRAEPTTQRYLVAAILMLEMLGLENNLDDSGIDFGRWRRAMQPMLSTMLRALKADQAFPATATFKLVFWRARLAGKWQPLLVPPLWYFLPKDDDLAQGGRTRPFLRRWFYLARSWPRLMWKAVWGLKKAE